MKFLNRQNLGVTGFRDLKYLKNTVQIFFFQGGAAFFQFLIVPLALGYLDPMRYGLWLVINSVMNWLVFFDMGLGNGLRNKLAEALALKKINLAQKYVSTTYFIITLISLVLIISFSTAHQFVNWGRLFNAPDNFNKEFNLSMILCIIFFCIRFIFNLIINVLNADQRIGISGIYNFLSLLLSFVAILLLKIYTESSFLYLCLAMIVPHIIVLLGMNIYFFMTKYKKIRPSFGSLQMDLGKNITSLGFKFFIIQILVMIVFSTDNVIISNLFGPEAVTPYNIAFQYMSIGIFLFNIILAPSWSAFTEAHALNDRKWIIITLRRLLKLWLCVVGAIICLVMVSQPVYKLWIGPTLEIPDNLTVLMAIVATLTSFNMIFANYINGVGKIDLLAKISVFITILNIPLSILFGKSFGMGPQGVILATIICISFGSFVLPLQTYLLINNKAKGVWNQ